MKTGIQLCAAAPVFVVQDMGSMMPGGGWTTLVDGEKGMENFNRVGEANWRAADGANSGIFMRCANPAEISDKSCYEANIFDQRPDLSYGTGGKWNTYDIKSGPVALQYGSGVVKFRKVQIRPL